VHLIFSTCEPFSGVHIEYMLIKFIYIRHASVYICLKLCWKIRDENELETILERRRHFI